MRPNEPKQKNNNKTQYIPVSKTCIVPNLSNQAYTKLQALSTVSHQSCPKHQYQSQHRPKHNNALKNILKPNKQNKSKMQKQIEDKPTSKYLPRYLPTYLPRSLPNPSKKKPGNTQTRTRKPPDPPSPHQTSDNEMTSKAPIMNSSPTNQPPTAAWTPNTSRRSHADHEY